jgi:hypothetical protein
MKFRFACATFSFLAVALSIAAQNAEIGAVPAQVPPLIQFSNAAADEAGNPLNGVVSIAFSLYGSQKGGEPLWAETQDNVQLDAAGHYSVQLGATSPSGVPAALFTSGESRWLGVRIAGQAEQPRVLLVSVPYALKAGDAATIGGLPPSAFVRAEPGNDAAIAAPAAALEATAAPAFTPMASVAGTGTADFVPLWTNSSNLGSSVLFQSGSGSTANVGINTTTPATALDVEGAGTFRGALNLPNTAAATAAAGANSHPLEFVASAFSSATSTPVHQTFQWQAEAAGNNTSSPSATLNLLFGEGATKPSETQLQISSNGQLTFAPGQTFPGTGPGTITGVTAGTGLTGGGTSGNVPLALNTATTDARYAQLNAANTFSQQQNINAKEIIVGNSSFETLDVTQPGTQATGDGIHGITNATGGTGVFGMGAIGLQGVAAASGGLSGLFRGTQLTNGNGNNTLIGDPGCGAGYAGLGFIPRGSLTGCTNYALIGGPQGETFLNSSGTAKIHFRSNNNELATLDNSGNLNVIGQNGGGNLTVAGKLTVNGEQILNAKQVIKASSNYAALFVTQSGGSGNGVQASTNSANGAGVFGQGVHLGVYGASAGASQEGQKDVGNAGVWGDTGGKADSGHYGVLGTANGNSAGGFFNTSALIGNTWAGATLYLQNDSPFQITILQPYPLLFEAYSPSAQSGCTINIVGEETCDSFNSGAFEGDTPRRVAMYATESPENWFEDVGSGQLSNGVARIELDPTFAQTVNTGMDYHVFLTPKGDSEGLYVSNETPHGFEVHEQRGGHSNIAFDYRIMARRRGYENIRLKDVTAQFEQQRAEHPAMRRTTRPEDESGIDQPAH